MIIDTAVYVLNSATYLADMPRGVPSTFFLLHESKTEDNLFYAAYSTSHKPIVEPSSHQISESPKQARYRYAP